MVPALLMQACLGTKFLKEDENLLYEQKIAISKKIDKEVLSPLFAQKPNRQFPIISFSPYVWFYYWGLKSYDVEKYEAKRKSILAKFESKISKAKDKEKAKKLKKLERHRRKELNHIERKIEEGNTLMRWGEPLAVYDPSLSKRTADRFDLLLASKGYFSSRIEHRTSIKRKRVTSVYEIDIGEPYVIDTLFLQTGDSLINRLIEKNQEESKLKIGDNYNQTALSEEREHLDQLLQNNGYFDFSRQYVQFEVDTAFGESRKVAIKTIINKPKSGNHRVFHVDSVNFVTDVNVKRRPDSLRVSESYNGITYRRFEPQYSKKILSRRVFIEKDSVYSKSDSYGTQRQLANLDHFKFINIKYDSTEGGLTAYIFTSPLQRYQWTNEVGVNVTQGYPGPFYNISFKKRNVFRGLEIFEMNGRVGIEGVTSVNNPDNVFASIEAGVNASLTFPQFVLPLSNVIKRRLGQINPKTRLLAGYTYTERPEYVRKNTNLSNTYSWQDKRNTSFQVTAADVSLIESNLTDSLFRVQLQTLEENGNRLINTFRPSLVSSISGSATWNFNSYGINFSNSSFLRLFLESGGTTLNFVNTEFLERESLEFYKFYKINADYRRNKEIDKNSSVAYRINAGYAQPYGENLILPYEKYFFAGGSNGIRAWRPRRLGPGSYVAVDSATNTVSYGTEQNAEILMEGSLELRKNLFGFIDYAFFVDFGNTWTIREDESRPGTKFEADRFFKEIAIGGGAGLRFDFSFLILRLDAGLKLYDPARPEGKRFILNNGFYDAPFTPEASEPIILNIGIGYPF